MQEFGAAIGAPAVIRFQFNFNTEVEKVTSRKTNLVPE